MRREMGSFLHYTSVCYQTLPTIALSRTFLMDPVNKHTPFAWFRSISVQTHNTISTVNTLHQTVNSLNQKLTLYNKQLTLYTKQLTLYSQ